MSKLKAIRRHQHGCHGCKLWCAKTLIDMVDIHGMADNSITHSWYMSVEMAWPALTEMSPCLGSPAWSAPVWAQVGAGSWLSHAPSMAPAPQFCEDCSWVPKAADETVMVLSQNLISFSLNPFSAHCSISNIFYSVLSSTLPLLLTHHFTHTFISPHVIG